MFTEKIDTIIASGVETIGGKKSLQKGLAQLYGTGMMMRNNFKQRIEECNLLSRITIQHNKCN